MTKLNKPSSIQSVAWETGLQAVRESRKFTSFEDFRLYLRNNMRQNAEGVRERYTNLITLRLFPERSLNGIAPKAWTAYQDDKILEDIARLTTLEAEPIIAKFVLEHILAVPNGLKSRIHQLWIILARSMGCTKETAMTDCIQR